MANPKLVKVIDRIFQLKLAQNIIILIAQKYHDMSVVYQFDILLCLCFHIGVHFTRGIYGLF